MTPEPENDILQQIPQTPYEEQDDAREEESAAKEEAPNIAEENAEEEAPNIEEEEAQAQVPEWDSWVNEFEQFEHQEVDDAMADGSVNA